jgi:hypothetical protein
MKVSQRDIIEVPFNLPQGLIVHPAIVISCENAIQQEDNHFVAVMITSDKIEDEFSFRLSDVMINKPMPKNCQVRLHLISYFGIKDISSVNTYAGFQMKVDYYNRLCCQILKIVFAIPC